MTPSYKLVLMALLPKNHLSRWVGWAVRRKWPFQLHTLVRNTLIKLYRIDTEEAELGLDAYPTFGEFFIRRLKAGARPLAPVELISPVDGLVTQRGLIQTEGRLLQAKDMDYALKDLLPPQWDAADFIEGFYLTLYLAPYNYHRVHAPCAMKVERIAAIPGRLWPVNGWSVNGLDQIFIRNERVLVGGQGRTGKVVLALIGATNVGRITLDHRPGFHANATIAARKKMLPGSKPQPYELARGEGLGCFEMGSTVVLLLSKEWVPTLLPWVLEEGPKPIRMGEALALS